MGDKKEGASLFRKLPSVDKLLKDPKIAGLEAAAPRPVLLGVIRKIVEDLRGRIQRSEAKESDRDRDGSGTG